MVNYFFYLFFPNTFLMKFTCIMRIICDLIAFNIFTYS